MKSWRFMVALGALALARGAWAQGLTLGTGFDYTKGDYGSTEGRDPLRAVVRSL